MPLKRSAEFRKLRSRLAGRAPHPVADSWIDDGFHFFMFGLAPASSGQSPRADGGVAVFAMHPESPGPISAISVVPTESADHAEITNLREPGGSYIAPLPSGAKRGASTGG